MILVTGAAGKTGLAVIKALKGSGQPVRAFIRRHDQHQQVMDAGAAETVVGDFENPGDLGTAVQGIQAVYHICPNMHPAEVEIGRLMLNACLFHGINHLVYHSVLYPQIEAMPHHWNKLRVEEMLINSGMPYVILQPAPYMHNVLPRWAQIKEEGIYQIPYRVETRLSMVDLEDAAEIAAQALLDPEYLNGSFDLVAPGLISQEEIAERLSKACGRSVRAEQIGLDEWRSKAESGGMNAYAIDALVKMFQYYTDHGLSGNSKTLGFLLGRTPTSFEEFLVREAPLTG